MTPERDTRTPGSAAGGIGKRSGRRWAGGLFAVGLGGLACVGCCAVPLLVPLGLLAAGGVAVAETGLTVVSGLLLLAAMLLWVWRARGKRGGVHRGCADQGCGCGG